MAELTVSGLRGIINENLNNIDILNVINNFVQSLDIKTCAIGRDTRSTSNMIHQAVISVLLAKNCEIQDLGITSTPSVFRHVKMNNLDGGIVITSSHNPKEWNGLKLIVKPGRIIKPNELNKVSQTSKKDSFLGTVLEVKSCYYSDIIKQFKDDKLTGIKVGIDLGGGAGSVFVKEIFMKLGCEVYSVNEHAGIFNRIIDPVEDSLKTLSSLVLRNECDIGFGFDADVDRLVIMDEKGLKIQPDFSLLAGIKYIEHKKGLRKAAISIDSSLSIIQYLNKIQCEIITTKVGEGNVLDEIISKKCDLGGEGSSGGFIYPEFNLCRDGILLALMTTYLVKKFKNIDNVFSDIEKFYQNRTKIKTNPENYKIIEKYFSTKKDTVLIDGVKIKNSDESWVLIRPSNTEKCIRVSAEAKSKNDVNKLIEEYVKLINKLLTQRELKE